MRWRDQPGFWFLLAAITLGIIGILNGVSNTLYGETQILDFSAEWCGPCQSMQPVVEQLQREGHKISRIDVDRNKQLVQQYGVGAIPCFVFLADGKEVDRVVGETTRERLLQRIERIQPKEQKPQSRPREAWRYVEPTSYRAAIVRIIADEGGNKRALGSGTIVKWSGHFVILTARHVIQNAKAVTVRLLTGKKIKCRVVKVDQLWDCAVLEPLEPLTGAKYAELELGDKAMFKPGDRLESCGLGSDDKLAANTGIVISYKRSTAAMQGPDDWIEISGQARQGDSGGPVFNDRGRVVGVLWGTDGKSVLCVQAGRLHVVLDAAAKQFNQMAFTGNRNPTPAMPEESPCCPPGTPNCVNPPVQVATDQGAYLIPFRNEVTGELNGVKSHLNGIEARQAELNRRLDALTQQQQSPATAPPPSATQQEPLAPLPKPKEEDDTTKMSNLEQRLYDRLKSMPIQGPITRRLESNLEEGRGLLSGDDWLRDRLNFSGSIAKWAAFVVGFLILVYVIHKRNERRLEAGQSLLPIGDKLAHGLQAAAVAHPALAPVAAGVTAVHGAAEKGVEFLHQRMESMENRLHNTALQTPTAPSQPIPSPPHPATPPTGV